MPARPAGGGYVDAVVRAVGSPVEINPLVSTRWPDLVDLFERPGPRGSWPRTSACYCMFWRLPPAEYEDAFRERSLEGTSGGPNKDAMEALIASATVPGLLAYRDGRSIGWASVSPRLDLARLDHVPTLDTPDDPRDERTWSVSCLYVHRSEWRTGVGTALLQAAIARAAEHGGSTIEGYPVKAGSIDPYTGYDTMFASAGFRLLRPGRGKGRAVWRKQLSG